MQNTARNNFPPVYQENGHGSSLQHENQSRKLANKAEQSPAKTMAISVVWRAQSCMLSFITEAGLGKVGRVTGPETPSRTDQSLSVTNAVTRFEGIPVQDFIVNECLLLLGSTSFANSLVPELEDVLVASVFRKRQTAAQSSILEVGYSVLQARRADSTRNRAAEACEGALLMMLTTSSLVSTSHTPSVANTMNSSFSVMRW
uniref:Uncharacterized protein n=1 Tax=Arundo donax TaxID=35708 RepID=A0A0A9EWV5_ARUDO